MTELHQIMVGGKVITSTEWVKEQKENMDAVNHPTHYTSHPNNIECIDITEHMNFCVGNAVKYLWRSGKKGDEIEDLRKAAWYIQREIERLEKLNSKE